MSVVSQWVANHPDKTQPGDWEPGALNLPLLLHTTGTVTKGQVLVVDGTSHGWKTALTTQAGQIRPFAVATRTSVTGQVVGNIGVRGVYFLTADGAIPPNTYVMPSATTAGRVIAWAIVSPDTVVNDQRVVGLYTGHPDESDGLTTPTTAQAGDTIRVRFGEVG